MNHILRSDGLLERCKWSYLSCLGLPAVPSKKNLLLLYWLREGEGDWILALFLFTCLWTSPESLSMHTNNQPSWPHNCSITYTCFSFIICELAHCPVFFATRSVLVSVQELKKIVALLKLIHKNAKVWKSVTSSLGQTSNFTWDELSWANYVHDKFQGWPNWVCLTELRSTNMFYPSFLEVLVDLKSNKVRRLTQWLSFTRSTQIGAKD